MARVIAPDGSSGEIPDDLLEEAMQEGFRPETQQDIAERAGQAAHGDKPIVAGALGAARAATLGLSDLLLTKTGVADREALSGLQQYNPGASAVGEAGGIIGSLLLPGAPLAQIGKLGHRAGAAAFAGDGALASAGAKALAGAIEGGFYGAGSGLSSTVLGDPELNAEKIIAGAGFGALVGGVAGAAIPTLGEGIKRMMPSTKLDTYADDWAIKAIAGSGHKKAIKGLDHKGITGDVADFARKRGILTPLASADDMFARAESINREAGDSIGEILKRSGKSGHIVDGGGIADKADDLVAKYRKGNFGDQGVANRLEKELELIRQKGPMTLGQAEDLKKSFDPYLKFNAEQGPIQEGIKELRALIARESETALDGLSPKLGEAFRKAKKDFRMSREIADLAEERVFQLRNNASFGMREQLMAAGGIAAGEPVTGAAAALGASWLKRNGPQLYASALGAIKDSRRAGMVAKSFGQQIRDRLDGAADALGAYRGILASAAARSDAELLATHVVQAQTDPEYLAAMEAAGFQHNKEREMQEVLRIEGLQRVNDALEGINKRLDDAADGIISGDGAKTPKQKSLSRQERLGQYKSSLHALARMAMGDSVDALSPPSELAEHAPEIAPLTSAVAQRAVEFLLSKMPRHPYAELPQAARPHWQPSDFELARLERYMAAIHDPVSSIETIRVGRVTNETVEALQAIYPKMLDDLRERLSNRVSTMKAPLTIEQRRAVSAIMGSQSAPMPVREPPPPPAPGIKPKGGLPKRNIQDILTPSQRIEGR